AGHGGFVGDVGLQHEPPAIGMLAPQPRVEAPHVAVEHRDRYALAQQPPDDGMADAAGAAGHQGDVVRGETGHVRRHRRIRSSSVAATSGATWGPVMCAWMADTGMTSSPPT